MRLRSAFALLLGTVVVLMSLVSPAMAQGGSIPCPADLGSRDESPFAPEPLSVTYFGTSTLLFSDGRDRILVDGFFSRPRLRTLLTSALVSNEAAIGQGLDVDQPPLRAVLVAHGHHDHAMDVAAIVRSRPDVAIVGTPAVERLVQGQGIGARQLCRGNERAPLVFGAFRVWAYEVEHGPSPAPLRWLLDRPPSADFSRPAGFAAYKDPDNLSFLIEHRGRRILVHPSAGARDLTALDAEVVFLGLAGVGKMSRPDATAYFRAVLGPRTSRVIPIHWDRFTTPLGEPLRPIPWPLDDVPRGFTLLCDHTGGGRAPLVTRMEAGATLSVWNAEEGADACAPDVP